MYKSYAETVIGRGGHHDRPLTNLALKAFDGGQSGVAPRLFPTVPVDKQSDRYFTVDRDTWLLAHDTKRAPKTQANLVEFKVSSDAYFADNHALGAEEALEHLANADAAIQIRQRHTLNVTEGLLRGLEIRVANMVTSGSNLGSYVSLAGGAKWGDFVNSDPISDVTTGHAFIRQRTGLRANTMVIDRDTLMVVKRHPVLLDLFKYTSGGMLSEEQLRAVFEVDQILVGDGIKNVAKEGATASIVNIWGNNVLLARVEPAVSLQTATFGLGFRWTPPGFPQPFTVARQAFSGPGTRNVEVLEASYFQDEKIVATDLAYGILSVL